MIEGETEVGIAADMADADKHVVASVAHFARTLAQVQLNLPAVRLAVHAIAAATDPVICSGVGKSGFVVAKMAASLNSLGIRAVYLNPTDALHGDLGIVSEHATVVLISNSGSTSELLRLVPGLQSRGCKLISIIGHGDSPLARTSRAALVYGDVQEIDANGLAPTTSTVVQMAMADALVAAASRVRGLSANQFFANHPAGALGKRFLRVEAMMRARDLVPTVGPDCPLIEVLSEMTAKTIGCAAVVDQETRLLGLLTDGDLRRAISARTDLYAARVGDVMQRKPQVVQRGQLVGSLMQKDAFFGRHFTVPVIDDGGVFLGMLVSIDLI